MVDYHFENSDVDGAEIVRRLKQQGFTHLCLCTAEYWKSNVRKKAEELNVPICPKPIPRGVVRGLV